MITSCFSSTPSSPSTGNLAARGETGKPVEDLVWPVPGSGDGPGVPRLDLDPGIHPAAVTLRIRLARVANRQPVDRLEVRIIFDHGCATDKGHVVIPVLRPEHGDRDAGV